MTLVPGNLLAQYRIVSAIGAGGMGEVFRAQDTRLDRDVAIKVLPAELAQDPERLARFEREAKLLASLNHPNVAGIYGMEEVGAPLVGALDEDRESAGTKPAPTGRIVALVMELVEGEDLSERLKRGAIPIDESIAIAKQIAEGLEEAHEHGIIHRDLKPANVKLTPDGKVKILDFGLAKALEGDSATSATNSQLSNSPTMSRHMTEAGMIMGTAAYMSPEQARGKTVDKRADIWAFGVVLFEMLTGGRLFAGETVSDTLAAVLREEIPWARLPGETPRAVTRMLHRCLNRDPKKRLHSAADARIELDEALAGGVAEATGLPASKRAVTTRTATLLVGILLLALAGTLFRGLRGPLPAPPLTRVKMELAPGEPLGNALGANTVLSPDGRTIAFVTETQGATSRIRVRRLDELEANLLAGTDDARSPFFSPDGRWIGFETPTRLMKVGLAGGAPVTIADVGANPGRGATWSGSQIVFARLNTGLLTVADSGGEPIPLTTLDAARSERSHRWPSFLPGGKAVLFMVQHLGQNYEDADIEAVSVADGRRTVLVRGGAFPRYAKGGYLLFVRNHVLYALRFDPERLKVEEPATPVLEGVMGYTGDEARGDGSAEVSVSEQGDLLYRATGSGGGGVREGSDLLWTDEKGQETAFHESIYVTSQEISPDGKRIAYDGRSARGQGIFIRDIERGTVTPLTTDGAGELSPAWSPDGQRLAYTRAGTRVPIIRIRSLDSAAPELEIPTIAASGAGPTSWLPEGTAVVAGLFLPATLNDIFLVPLNNEKPRPLVSLPGNESLGRVSPNGRWLAYQSDEKGPIQVFVTSIAATGPRLQVSVRGGGTPRWSRDGRLLYFVEVANANQSGPLMAVSVSEQGESLRFGPPRQISSLLHGIVRPNYDIHPDGRILALNPDRRLVDARQVRGGLADGDSAHVILVTGWREELARLMSEKK